MQNPLMSPEKVGARRRAPGGQPQKYHLSPEGRQLIIQKYDSSSESISELEKALGVPRWIVSRWASELGMTRPSPHRWWTQEEIDFLKKNFLTMSTVEISEKLDKPVSTIRRKASRLGFYKTGDLDGYTMQELMQGLGLSPESNRKVIRWINNGWLKGKKQRTELKNEAWYFKAKDIRSFIKNHRSEIDLRRVDQLWFLDVIFDA